MPEASDLAELRLALISVALKSAYRNFTPADFDRAYDIAKRLKRMTNPKEHSDCNRHFWEIIFTKAERPILPELFRQLEDRGTRYDPLLLKLFPPEIRPRQREVLVDLYRKGKISEAFRAFKKIYLEIVAVVIDPLKSQETGLHSSAPLRRPPCG